MASNSPISFLVSGRVMLCVAVRRGVQVEVLAVLDDDFNLLAVDLIEFSRTCDLRLQLRAYFAGDALLQRRIADSLWYRNGVLRAATAKPSKTTDAAI